ncbi:Chloroperoxidase [Xylaria bambusicola]|uniref:Chloroperoxidase n=1 Tax=Xylaria bambusicola TaxID=326684 RepID=UPI002007A70E|nr:Chloroperoxidase [Xylaria bambusicola]KAI0508816.1 Chloroperoxidase [Xylaria bambusicola]
MRSIVIIAGAIAAVSAFPTVENLARLARHDGLPSLAGETSIETLSEQLTRLEKKRLLFDPLTDPIDVSGKHAFKAPDFEHGDQRGPCPGLNALANHGYIPHNGVVSLVEVIEQANTVFGMGLDLVGILAGVATLYVGTPLSLNPGFSIGGMSPKSENILGNLFGLLGKPRGLDGTHNIIESDSSATRNDLYNTGNAHTMNLTLFQKMAKYADDDGFITMDDLADRAVERFYESIATNPSFYYGPYTGTIARNAGYAFMGRFLSNHTKEHPLGGHLSKEVLASFLGVCEENGKQVYREGHERIPENWYRLAVDYSLNSYNLDLVAWVTKHPILLSIGGNLGEVNSFAGVDIGNITGGVLNAAKLLEGNNLICFALTVLKTFVPSSLTSSIFATLEPLLNFVDDILLHPLLDLSCPVFADLSLGGTDLWSGLLHRYPGARQVGMAF